MSSIKSVSDFQKFQMGAIMDSILKPENRNETCPEGLCDGSGYIDDSSFDDMHDVRCLCNREESMVESMDDDSDLINLK